MAAIDILAGSASDEQLARLVRDGNQRAFDCLYLRHLDALRRYTARILRDESAAEDAVQVALMNAYRSLRAGRLPRAVQPWLFRIARNAAFAQCAQRKETLELPESVAARSDERGNDVGAELVAGIAQLPERQRHAFILRELRGLSVRETSEALELGESQVEQLVFAAKARLAELLVFGGPASCEVVQAIAGSSLDRQQRRALKRHVHHCRDCRASLGDRMQLGSRIGGLLEALRRVVDLLGPAKLVAVSSLVAVAATPAIVPREPAPAPQTAGVSPPARLVDRQSEVGRVPAARFVAAPKLGVLEPVVPTPTPTPEGARIRTATQPTPQAAPQPRADPRPEPTVTSDAPPVPTRTPTRTAPPPAVAPPVEPVRTTAARDSPPPRSAPPVRVAEPSHTPAPTAEREPEPSPTPTATPTAERAPQPPAEPLPTSSQPPRVPTSR